MNNKFLSFLVFVTIVYALIFKNPERKQVFDKVTDVAVDTVESMVDDIDIQSNEDGQSEAFIKKEQITNNIIGKYISNKIEQEVTKSLQKKGINIKPTNFIVKTLQEGNKQDYAYCGSKISIHYKEYRNGVLFDNAFDDALRLTIGSQTVNSDLEIGIIGMSTNEKRAIEFIDENKKYVVQLLSIEDEEANSSYFDRKIGNKEAIICGDLVNAKYKIMDIKGNVIGNNRYKETSWRLGHDSTPYFISKNIHGMLRGGKRVVTAPSKQLNNLFNSNGYPYQEARILLWIE